MADEKVIERHYHDPTQGQVHKALYQFLVDQGITNAKLEEIVHKKLGEAVTNTVERMMKSDRFDKLIVAAVAHVISGEKKAFEGNSYGFHNHVRDLVKAELQRLVLAEYQISVTKKE